MKIYTRGGDKGTTVLLNGQRVYKCDPAPEACGTLDEFNVELGCLAGMLEGGLAERLRAELHRIQRRLFVIGSIAACPSADAVRQAGLKSLSDRDCEWIEQSIDSMEAELKPLTAFILPGGHATALQAHRVRAISRRAERRMVALAVFLQDERGCHHLEHELAYVNRLADYFFVVARYCNHVHQQPEFEWHNAGSV